MSTAKRQNIALKIYFLPTGIMIQGVVTSADAHVASLVNRQSSNKKKTAKTAKMPPARRPNTMQRPWQPPTPSQPFQRQNYQNRYELLSIFCHFFTGVLISFCLDFLHFL